MTDTTPSPALPGPPTPEEIEAATRILMRAWAPGLLLPGGHPKTDERANDEDDPDEYCGCAGTDDDGESLGCNCGGGCVCDNCSYSDYARYGRCWTKNCGKKPAFRVVRFGLVDQHVQEPTRLGAVCPHTDGEKHFCTADTVYVAAGPQLQIFDYQPACSIAHAVQLRDTGQQHNTDGRDQYSIEAWTYTPHDRELPTPLPQLRDHLRSAHDSTRFAVKAVATNGDPGYWLTSVRQALALAAWHARRPLEQPDADDADFDDEPSTPVQEEPDWPDAPW
ncbi:hypothetical protein [Streptomyces sp. NBC_00620]|uniref:hypothetical protein n=1 Tax=Streptomyces sp. NBC_00620 TaxID=2903666 RepID=UPI00225B20C3|nr:hypothetical protein [Streptomyces sp. NBC_00620]MCX4974269.1 hypothetical protein [Streptomyces sp. NBC_00620]